MEKPRVLVADTNQGFRSTLTRKLDNEYIVRFAPDSRTALSLLEKFLPDIMIIDLDLDGVGGLQVIREAAEKGIRPLTVACDTHSFVSDWTLDRCWELQVAFVLPHPSGANLALARINDLRDRLPPAPYATPDAQVKVTRAMLELGVPTQGRGFAYLREAVLQKAAEPDQPTVKVLYANVARRFGTSVFSVERAMRYAVELAWESRREEVWKQYFPVDAAGNIPHPTNTEFISRLAMLYILF